MSPNCITNHHATTRTATEYPAGIPGRALPAWRVGSYPTSRGFSELAGISANGSRNFADIGFPRVFRETSVRHPSLTPPGHLGRTPWQQARIAWWPLITTCVNTFLVQKQARRISGIFLHHTELLGPCVPREVAITGRTCD